MIFAYLKAENIKNRHSVAAKLFWIVPLACFAVSFALAGKDYRYYQMNQYNWWYTTFFPMLLLFSTAFAVQREKKLKNRAMGVLPADMKGLWSAKIIYSMKTVVLAVLLLFGMEEIFSIIFMGNTGRPISFASGLTAIVLWIVLSLWQIPLWLFINQVFGFAASVLLGLACNIGLGVMGALSASWMLNPFCYISRLMCPVLKILPNGLLAEPGSQTFFPQVLDTRVIPIGIVLSLVLFVLGCIVTAGWYRRKGIKGWES